MSTFTTVHNVRIFDGTRVLAETAVRFASATISRIGDATIAQAGDILINGQGAMLLPGLIDAHTHLQPGALQQALTFGVTTELDMFSKPDLVHHLKQLASTRTDLADLRSAGIGATAPGGHPSMMYGSFPYATGPDQAEEFVLARIAEGCDYLKIFYDRGLEMPIPIPQLTRETLNALIQAARTHGLTAVVHANSMEAASDAVAAGAHGLQHLPVDQRFTEDFVQRLAKSGVTVTPTLSTAENLLGRAGGKELLADPDLGPFFGEFWQQNLAYSPSGWIDESKLDYGIALANMAQLIEAGVPLLAGTDAPNPGTAHGASLHRELELLVEAGLIPTKALQAATSGPATVYGLTDRGIIEPGKRADLLLVDGDPTITITDTRKIVKIWRGGIEHDRTSFMDSAAEQELIDTLRAQVQQMLEAVKEYIPAEAYQAIRKEY